MNKKITRRRFLRDSGLLTGVVASQLALPTWMPRLAFAQPYNDPKGDVLISIFLRGGADALNMVVPHGEDAYYQARLSLAIARPDDNSQSLRSIDLDGFFGLLTELAQGLNAFYQDMGADMGKVSVVVMSEFGRRLEENGSGGTDHGHGGVMLLAGDAFQIANPVHSLWPTLAPDKLDRGDLAVTIDYRDILSELLLKRLNTTALADIFPDYAMTDHQIW